MKKRNPTQEYLDTQLDRARADAMLKIRLAAKNGDAELAVARALIFHDEVLSYINQTVEQSNE